MRLHHHLSAGDDTALRVFDRAFNRRDRCLGQSGRRGEQKIPAAVDAAVARLRPILMTTLATTLGALPIALAFGSAGKSRVPLGIVIVGGMLFALVLTLYVVPALYSYLSSKKKPSNLDTELAVAEMKEAHD